MAQPSNATVQVAGQRFNAFSAHVGVETSHDSSSLPAMGRPMYSISCSVDVHDTTNMPFDTLKQLFELANSVTREKIIDLKVEFWMDETRPMRFVPTLFVGGSAPFTTPAGGWATTC